MRGTSSSRRRGALRPTAAERSGLSLTGIMLLAGPPPQWHQKTTRAFLLAPLLPPPRTAPFPNPGAIRPAVSSAGPRDLRPLAGRRRTAVSLVGASGELIGNAEIMRSRLGRGSSSTSKTTAAVALHATGAGADMARSAAVADSVVASLRFAIARLQPVLVFVWTVLVSLFRAVAPSGTEVLLASRLAVAAAIGMAIGLERRTSHRPAGIRTMSLVAMGACMFTLVSQYGFAKADQARVAASVASGVGFIGAGVITTAGKEGVRGRGQSANDMDGDVRGLTTASAIWITAGLGMACGTGLVFTATVGAALTVAVLKISRLQQSLMSKWYRVRAILRPRLAQKAAAAAAAADAAAKAAAAAETDEAENTGAADKDGKDEENDSKEDAEQPIQVEESEPEETYADITAQISQDRATIRARNEEAFRRAMDPDDDTPLPPEAKRKAVGVYRGEDSDDSDDYDGGDSDETYHDDPFFGGTWPGVPAKPKSWAPEKSAAPPLPIQKTRTRSRVLPSRERREHLRTRGLHVPLAPRPPAVWHTVASASAPLGEEPAPEHHFRKAGDLAEPHNGEGQEDRHAGQSVTAALLSASAGGASIRGGHWAGHGTAAALSSPGANRAARKWEPSGGRWRRHDRDGLRRKSQDRHRETAGSSQSFGVAPIVRHSEGSSPALAGELAGGAKGDSDAAAPVSREREDKSTQIRAKSADGWAVAQEPGEPTV